MKILITGGAGFIGHHFVEHILKNTEWEIVVLDRLSYASGGWDRLRDIDVFNHDRVYSIVHDLKDPIAEGVRKEIERTGMPGIIVHMAAETHVDRSIQDARPFVMANVLGTLSILEYALECADLQQFVYFSTDEVFGSAGPEKRFGEWDRYNSGNPYAATKAGGEELALAFANTHNLPVLVTHTMNAFGERQHPEKFIPKCVRYIQEGKTIPIHANRDRTKPGSRFWIHCRNIADALLYLLRDIERPFPRTKFNIVGEKEMDNLAVAQFIANVVGKPLDFEMVDYHSSRPGHDLRYALDGSMLKQWGWVHPVGFEQSLEKTVRWMLDNPKWL